MFQLQTQKLLMVAWYFGLNARGTILFLLIIPLANAQPLSFDYHNFSDAAGALKVDGYAHFSDSVIQLTGNAEDPDSSPAGRVISPKHMHLWDNSSGELNDFTTEFSFVIFSKNEICYGDGLAFFLASPNLPFVNDEGGGGLGILHNNPLSSSGNSFVAVEFDTYHNEWDPYGLHVGININSMKSEVYEEWRTYITVKKVYNCSIEYNSRNKNLSVSFTGYSFSGWQATQITQYLSYNIDIRDYLPESVIVGISAARGVCSEEHTLLSWSFSTSSQSNADPKKESNKKLMHDVEIGIGLSVCLLGWVLVLILLCKMKNRKGEATSESTSDVTMDDDFQMGTGPKKIGYDELVSATNNFNEAQKLGQGGFGGVYKGYVKNLNSYAAIKRISSDSRQGVKEYTAEVKIISQLRHRNLVKLTGWCHKKNDLLLIYEYMPNGSLHSHLFAGESILSWQVRYNIAQGLASALLYLQEGWEKCVLHRDIKSSNIMLDSNLNAKLGDFGLARLVDHEKGSRTTVTAGTMGYLDPEYMITGKARKESDIFSFGVVLLELASGRKAIHHNEMEGEVSLVEWVWELYGLRNLLAAADTKLYGVFDMQKMECLMVVGLWCANPDYKSRPSIREVIKVLNFEATLPILPQKMPVLVYLPPTANELFLSVSSSFEDVS